VLGSPCVADGKILQNPAAPYTSKYIKIKKTGDTITNKVILFC